MLGDNKIVAFCAIYERLLTGLFYQDLLSISKIALRWPEKVPIKFHLCAHRTTLHRTVGVEFLDSVDEINVCRALKECHIAPL